MLPAQYQTAVNTGPDQIAQSTTPTKADQLERVAEYVEALREENKQLHAKIAELESAHAVGDKRTRQQ